MTDIYDRLEELRHGSTAERIAARIWGDVNNRRGWRQETDGFDESIKHEILDKWIEEINALLVDFTDLLGLTFEVAEQIAKKRGVDYLRVTKKDGTYGLAAADYNEKRLNVWMDNGLISHIAGLG